MRLILLALFATSLSAAASPAWLPLSPTVSLPNDTAGAGLVGRAMAIVIVDWKRFEASTAINSYATMRWYWTDMGGANDCRRSAIIISVNGQPPPRDETIPEFLILGQDSSNGLLRALAGDAASVAMIVSPEGRVSHLFRCGDQNSFVGQLNATLQPKSFDVCLANNSSQYPNSCLPAFELLRLANISGGLALCAKKLGADGAKLAKDLAKSADTLLTNDIAQLGDSKIPPSQRFITRSQINDLLAAFPNSSKAADAAKAIKKLKDTKAFATEEAGWTALQDYLTQISAARPTGAETPVLQKKLLTGITTKFPNTYAAELAVMIRSAANITP